VGNARRAKIDWKLRVLRISSVVCAKWGKKLSKNKRKFIIRIEFKPELLDV
jgi:hypothetical protein